MAVVQMQRISICGLKKDKKAILETLQMLATVELNKIDCEDDQLEQESKSVGQEASKKYNALEQALSVIEEYFPEKEGMFAGLEGKRVVKRSQINKMVERAPEILESADIINRSAKEIIEKKANIVKIRHNMEALTPWVNLDIPMETLGTERTHIMIGTMPPEATLETVYEAIAKHADEASGVDVQIMSQDKDAVYLSIICMKDERRQVEEALRDEGFARTSCTSSKMPVEEIRSLEEEISACEADIEALKNDIGEGIGSKKTFKALADYYRMESRGDEVSADLLHTAKTFVVSGYVPKREAQVLQKMFSAKFDCVVDLEELAEEEEAPTILKNNKFSESLEGIVESYGVPTRRGFDPTAIMSYFYIVFFGLMLSDAGYGMLMALSCFILVKKYPNMADGTRKMLKTFGMCGISTMFWGVMFSGYFGDAPTIIAQVFFNKEFVIPPLWFAPLNDPIRLLLWCMLFGAVHLFIGLGIKGYVILKEKRYLDFVCDIVFWYMLLIGLVMMLLPSEIFSSISQMNITLAPWLVIISKILVFGGMGGILVMAGRGRKNVILRLALGAYDIYGVSGWLSDVLSYSRLLALGLATGVIGSVINMMASMVAGNILGKLLFIVIFVFGHVLNMAINILGAYVHTNRLQFVEFFGKFYEAGGKIFEPFATESKYIEIKEEF